MGALPVGSDMILIVAMLDASTLSWYSAMLAVI